MHSLDLAQVKLSIASARFAIINKGLVPHPEKSTNFKEWLKKS